MNNEEPFLYLMELTEGFYGEHGSVFNIHSLGYAELCEEFMTHFNDTWFCETNGIIADEEIKIIKIDQHDNAICEITEGVYGIIPTSIYLQDWRFYESLIDQYALRLGYPNGAADFNDEINIQQLKELLKDSPLILFKPFDQMGYFERASTIDLNKAELLKRIE
jgi:hypothetical protein